MHSRPLLDYLAYPEELSEPAPVALAPLEHIIPLEERLKDLEARLRASDPLPEKPKQDLTLSAQIEAILKRNSALQSAAERPEPPPVARVVQPARPAPRLVMEPPPTVPAANDVFDKEFVKFSEAVYLIGQASKRFIEQPQAQPTPQPQPHVSSHAGPTTVEVNALSALLRETVAAFRSVADDLAVSAGEIRHYATREERSPQRHHARPARYRDDEEIIELRESIADLQDRLDDLLHARRRRRY